MSRLSLLLLPLLWLLLLLAACTLPREEPRVLLDADGQRRWLATEGAATVGALLEQANIVLGEGDRVEPPSYTLLARDMTVRVVRVRQREITEERVVPFERTVRRDVTLPQGESRLVQLGQNGTERLTFHLTLEDGVEVARELLAREPVAAPRDEVLVIGARGSGEAMPFQGTIAYLEQGNAWLMRGDSLQKRPLTQEGDLDGHVFALSPDGEWLLFTRRPLGGEAGQGGPLNTLWLVNTRAEDDQPHSLALDSVLWAGWQPCHPAPPAGCTLRVALSTAERAPTVPGWTAHNDLSWFTLSAAGTRGELAALLPASQALLGWWGRSWAWSPDGAWIAWGDATRVGLVGVAEGGPSTERLLAEFLPYETRASWVWTPQLTWSPDSQSLFATIHRSESDRLDNSPAAPASGEQSERFDLFRLDLSGEAEPLVEEVGPFAAPRALERRRLVYGQVENPTLTISSRYTLMLHNGSRTPTPLFPPTDQPGLDVLWLAWDHLDDALVAAWQGDLYLVPLAPHAPPFPLTAEGTASHPEWAP